MEAMLGAAAVILLVASPVLPQTGVINGAPPGARTGMGGG
jgi:hypothetical protein